MKLLLEVVKKEVEDLVEGGHLLLRCLHAAYEGDPEEEEEKEFLKKLRLQIVMPYEGWYSDALEVVRLSLPNRLDDFISLYRQDKGRSRAYTISDLLLTSRGYREASSKFLQQILILHSAQKKLNGSLSDIRHLIRADILDSHLAAAHRRLKKGIVDAAGVTAGVVLEEHLRHVCENHKLKVTKKNPGVGDYNNILKNSRIIKARIWRSIQYLEKLIDLCEHEGKRESQKTEVSELIDGVERIIKSVW